MSYYNYNNTSLVVGSGNENHHLSVQSLGISLTNNLQPMYLVPDKSSFDYKATQGLNGNLDLSYYLTGEDFLANFIDNEQNFISGNFAGLTFSSGYLTSYSFAVQNYGPAMISANINFYGGLDGTFVPTRESSVVTGARPLNYSDCVLGDVSGSLPSDSSNRLTNAVDVSYGFTSEITPVYVVGEQLPREMRFNQKSIDVSIGGYDLTKYISSNFASGLYDAELTIGFSSPNNNTEWPYYSSDFSAGHDGWNNSNVTLTARDAYGEADVLEVFGNTSDNYHYIYRTAATPGRSYRVKGKVRVNESHDIDNVMVHDEDGINYAIGKAGAVPGLSVAISTRGEWVEFESDIFTPKTQYIFFYGRKGTSYVWGGTTSDQFVVKDIQTIPVNIQEYRTRGTLVSQNMKVSPGDKLKTEISLRQNKIGGAPSIQSISTQSANRGAEVTIKGINLLKATSISFGDQKIQAVDFVEVDTTNGQIKVTVPAQAIDGLITVRTPGGNDTWDTTFQVLNDGFL